ncbi:MAG: hypothetical protein ABFR50_06425, partial [Candidatus Fermentibacteria bacterium]
MIRLESLYTLIESSFDFLLAIDANEKTIYVSPLLERNCSPANDETCEAHLADILDPDSLQSFRNAIEKVHDGARGVIAMFATQVNKSTPIPMKVGYVESVHGGIYLFFGVQVDALRRMSDWEKEERVKELSCLYTVAEWIEVSASIRDFFIKLPEYLSRGMRSPEEAVVYSIFQGDEYGQKPSEDDYISVELAFGGECKGEIRVG